MSKLNVTGNDLLSVAQNIKTKYLTPAKVAVGDGLSKTENLQGITLKSVPMQSITWANLKSKRDNSQLVAGMWYRITDYVTTSGREDWNSASHQFDVVVLATDSNKLSEEARAVKHIGDTYFTNAGSNLEGWKIWYCLDNDTTRFDWADSTNGKGVIYRMIDEFRNDCPYDFKNIQFKRYRLLASNIVYDTEYANPALVNFFQSVLNPNNNYKHYLYGFAGREQYAGDEVYIENPSRQYEEQGQYIILDDPDWWESPYVWCEIDEGDYDWFFTFSNPADSSDASLTESVRANVFKGTALDNVFFGGNCIHNTFGNSCSYNTFGDDCSYSILGDDCSYSTFGNNYLSNILGDDCSYNTFGNYCVYNTLGNYCSYNTFGNSCFSNNLGDRCFFNTFGNSCIHNTFGYNCTHNTFGSGCNSNTFGDDCSYNTFLYNCSYNTFGNSCTYKTFGNNCIHNTFGNYCNSNTLGNYCSYNTFGNSCNYNTFGKQYMRFIYVSSGCRFNSVTSSLTTSPSNQIQNIRIALGVNNCNIVHDSLNDAKETTYQMTGSQIIDL